MGIGVYIHYPWCRRRCDYCDFAIAVAPLADIPHAGYREAICAELAVRGPELEGRELVSIYIGGGTPSIWDPEDLSAVLAAVADQFAADLGDLEITVEANPIDCQPDRLDAWRAAGVNRLSIGVQSIDAVELVVLGRDHSMGDGLAALDAAMDRFDTLSGDVILGTPGGRFSGLDAVEALADRDLDHLSIYELTIEERAPLGRAVARGDVKALDPDALADLYLATRDLLIARGYEHYEISSYARPGRRARHNSLYWAGAEYLGLGASASSFRRDGAGGVRWSNHKSVGRYLAAPADQRVAERRILETEDCARDQVWLGMRTEVGFEAALLEQLGDGPEIERFLLESGFAETAGERIRPTLQGFLFADRVAARVVGYSS